jgi:glutamyl-tRNA synthetase
MESLVENFDLESVNRAPAVFSYEKLDWFNGVYIRAKSTEELLELLIPRWIEGGLIAPERADEKRDYLRRIVPLIRERLSLLDDVVELTWFFFDDRFEIRDERALVPKKLTREDAARIITETHAALEKLDTFTVEDLEETLRGLVDALSLKTGQVFMTIRVAVTGSTVSPGLFETIDTLGRKRTLERLRAAMDILSRSEIE